MTDFSATVAAEIRGELADLRTEYDGRLKEIEQRLETRIAAAEKKQASDVQAIHEQLTRLAQDLSALKSGVGNVESLMRANHMAQVHLWGVTARLLKLSEKEVRIAQRKAEKALEGAR